MEPTGRLVNDRLLAQGILALVNLRGDRLMFYPRGCLPQYVRTHLEISDGKRARLLRDFLVNVARGIVTD
jgi:hypothetical protein